MRALIATATAICLAVILCVQLLPNPFQFDDNAMTPADRLTVSALDVYDKLMDLERQFFTKNDGILGYRESPKTGSPHPPPTFQQYPLLPEYEDLLKIVQQLSLRRHGDDKENQKLLTLLYAAVLSKLYGYTAATDTYPMDPNSGYIFALQLRVTMLHVTGGLSFSSTKFVVARQMEEYEKQVDGKVKTVLSLLSTRVKPTIEKLKTVIETSIEDILTENKTRGGSSGAGGKHVVMATAFDLLWQEMLALQVFASLAATGSYLITNNTGVVEIFRLTPSSLDNPTKMAEGSKSLLPDTLQSYLSFVDTQNLIENGRKELRSSILVAAQNKSGQLINTDAMERLTKASEILENSLYSRISGKNKERKMEKLAEQSKMHRDQIQQIEEQRRTFLEILTDVATEIRDPLRKFDFLSPKTQEVDKGHAVAGEFFKWDLKGTLERMRSIVKLHQILVHDLPFGMKEAVQTMEEPIDELISVFDRLSIFCQHTDLLEIVNSLESMTTTGSKNNLDRISSDENERMREATKKLEVLTSANVLVYFYLEAKRTMQQWGLPPSAGGGSYLIKDQLSEAILDFDEDMLRELGMSVAYSLKIMVKMADAKSGQNYSKNR